MVWLSIISDGDSRSVVAGGKSMMMQSEEDTRSTSPFMDLYSIICKNLVLENILSAGGKMKVKHS